MASWQAPHSPSAQFPQPPAGSRASQASWTLGPWLNPDSPPAPSLPSAPHLFAHLPLISPWVFLRPLELSSPLIPVPPGVVSLNSPRGHWLRLCGPPHLPSLATQTQSIHSFLLCFVIVKFGKVYVLVIQPLSPCPSLPGQAAPSLGLIPKGVRPLSFPYSHPPRGLPDLLSRQPVLLCAVSSPCLHLRQDRQPVALSGILRAWEGT